MLSNTTGNIDIGPGHITEGAARVGPTNTVAVIRHQSRRHTGGKTPWNKIT
jgi:hypothetical protein